MNHDEVQQLVEVVIRFSLVSTLIGFLMGLVAAPFVSSAFWWSVRRLKREGY